MLHEKTRNLARDFLRLGNDLVATIACQGILLVNQNGQIGDTESRALRSGQLFKRTVYQNDCRSPFLVCCYCVAHGGAGAGPSSTHADY